MMQVIRIVSVVGAALLASLIVGDRVEYARVAAPMAKCSNTMGLEPHWVRGFGEHHTWLEGTEPYSDPVNDYLLANDYLIVDLTTARLYQWDYWGPSERPKFGVSTRWTFWPTNWQWIYHQWELHYNCRHDAPRGGTTKPPPASAETRGGGGHPR